MSSDQVLDEASLKELVDRNAVLIQEQTEFIQNQTITKYNLASTLEFQKRRLSLYSDTIHLKSGCLSQRKDQIGKEQNTISTMKNSIEARNQRSTDGMQSSGGKSSSELGESSHKKLKVFFHD
ncbi:uncharacterized protein CELE_C39B10.4 [Caenorhabditis elegans]|uniref:Uncharacterized protein n=1 Tax=Caenorhabditis elegans TaxID=6239 RepID=Q18519_CAEEL|nr:Uncharacterized protein CELE_C39B10.4 [Caenorhabditis elegans]CAA90333.2 Uncharacterized protein CELE_C39B10.4 [Caenorhabditis elegans]|eukprot:NP_509751.2 Uncharacterized protein CELE_C39B10.4 [Caenorhabditis elegans]